MTVAFHPPGHDGKAPLPTSSHLGQSTLVMFRLALLLPLLGRPVLSSRFHASVVLRCLLAASGHPTLG